MIERLTGESGGPGSFTVPSSDGDGTYTVVYQADSLIYCPCPGHANHGRCRHSSAVLDAVKAERGPLVNWTPDEFIAVLDR